MNLAADLVDFDFSGSTDSADLQEDTESISSLTDGDSSPSHSISSVSGKPKRRRKPANPYCANGERASMYILKPRVFKNDLRRYFMNMYTNVFNAFDADFLRSYASTIFHPKMEYLCSNVGKLPALCSACLLCFLTLIVRQILYQKRRRWCSLRTPLSSTRMPGQGMWQPAGPTL